MRLLASFLRGLAIVPMLVLTCILTACLWQLPFAFPDRTLFRLFLAGIAGGIAVFTLVCRFSPFYIFGHEMTHWLVAKLFRRRTGKVRFGLYSGFVEVENANVWITLAPYVIPFYLLVTAGLAELAAVIRPLPRAGVCALAVLMGAELAYHFVMTVFALSREQEDLKRYGVVFSLVMILTGNVLLLTLALLAATGQWGLAGRLFIANCLTLWRHCHAIA